MSQALETPIQPPSASFKSVAAMWHHRIESLPDGDAMYFKTDGEWETMSWRQAGLRSHAIANGLHAMGLQPEQRCCILATTSVDWILEDMGILCAGGATTTIYPSSTPEECEYIINDCEAVLVFCDTDAQTAKLLQIRERIPQVKHVVVSDGKSSKDGWIKTLAQVEAEGEAFAKESPDTYKQVVDAITPQRLATLIYTSGTTGKPKGVMLTHDAWIFESEAIDRMGMMTPADKQYLFLPLSHVFAKVMQIIFIRLGVPTAVDGNIDNLIENLGYVQPTWMGAVPRVFEKAYNKIVSRAKDAGGVKYSLFQWAVGIGREVSQMRQKQQEPAGMLKLKYQIADKLVFSKVKDTFGGKLRFLISGGAPLSVEIAEFFHACDILILEGYGLTESGAASCINHPEQFIFGTVGQPLPGVDVQIAEDGEILLKGRGIMRGYYGRPEATAESLSDDGWLHTGDIGTILETGHVKITDRKKELIVTAGGKNIAPAHFQNLLKARSLYVSQVLMHGDRRNYCVALVTINEETVGKWATDNGLTFRGYADLASRPEVKALIMEDVESINKELPPYETVKQIHLCDEDWTVENGFLTPSFKVKRRIVEGANQDALDEFYEGTVHQI